jgi:hypothetical protein
MNNCDAQEHGTVTDHDNDDPMVPNRRVLRDGEVGTQTTRNSNGQLVPYGFEDGYPITLSDLVDPGPGGLSDEVSPSLQRSIAAALTDLMATLRAAMLRLTGYPTSPGTGESSGSTTSRRLPTAKSGPSSALALRRLSGASRRWSTLTTPGTRSIAGPGTASSAGTAPSPTMPGICPGTIKLRRSPSGPSTDGRSPSGLPAHLGNGHSWHRTTLGSAI